MALVQPGYLYDYLRGQFADSGMVGYVPPDGADFGITNGSADEWARFGLAVAKQESDLNSRSYNADDPGGSVGLFQFGQGQTQFTHGQDQFDPQNSANAFVRSVQHYVGNGGSISDLGATFGSIRRPNETLQHMGWASKIAGQQGGPGAFQPSTDTNTTASSALSGVDPALQQQIKQLQSAQALLNQGQAPVGTPATPDYASLNLAPSGGMGGGGGSLIQAIRMNRARRALAIQNAINAGGQLGKAGVQAYGNFLQQSPGGTIDPFEAGGSMAFG